MLKVAASLALLTPAVPLLGLDALASAKPTIETALVQEKAWLGIVLGETDMDGVLVTTVTPGSPADRAGLESGDRIEAADEQELAGTQALIGLMGDKQPGDALILDVVRGDRAMTLLARLVEKPEEGGAEFQTRQIVTEVEHDLPGHVEGHELHEEHEIHEGHDVGSLFRPREQGSEPARLRALAPVDPSDREVESFWAQASSEDGTAYLGVYLADSDGGAGVDSVEAGSAAQEAGVRAGDVIIRFNHQAVRDSDELVELVRSQDPGAGVIVVVERDGEQVELHAMLGSREPETVEIPGMAFFQSAEPRAEEPRAAEPGVRVFRVPSAPAVPAVPAVPQGLFGGQRGNQNPFGGGFDAEAFERDMENWAEQFESSFEGWAEQFEDEMEHFSEQFEDWGETFGEAVENDVEMFLGELPDMLEDSAVLEKLIDGAAKGQAMQQRIFSSPEGTRIFRIEGDKQPGGSWTWSQSDEEVEGRAEVENFFQDGRGGQVRSQGRLEMRADDSKAVERLAGRLEAMEREMEALRRENAELRRRLDR